MIDGKYEYFAFISYKEEDAEWAKWLQRKLEHYKLPTALRKDNPDLPERISPIYEYKSEAGGGRLKEIIWKGLTSSKYLVVICSPRSGGNKSLWINNGIRYFIDSGQEEYIIPFIVEGTPKANNPEEECFPNALLGLKDERELRGININEMGRDAAAVKVVSRMFDVKFDTLWQRYERELRSKRLMWIGGAVLFALFGLGIGGYFVRQNRIIENQNERLQQDSIITVGHLLRIQNDSIKLSAQNDSISLQNMLIMKQRDSLDVSNKLLAEERDNVLRTNWKMMENQSRAVAEKALSLIANGDYYSAKIITSEVMPLSVHNPNRPITPEIERAIRESQNNEDFVIRGHSGTVRSVLFSHSGKLILSASDDKTIKIWNADDGSLVRTLYGHTGYVNSAIFSDNDKLIISASKDRTIKIWNANNGKLLKTINGNMEGVSNVTISPDNSMIASSAFDTIRVWNSLTGDMLYTIKEPMGFVNSIAFSHDGTQIITAHGNGPSVRSTPMDNSIKLWDSRTGKLLNIIRGHQYYVYAASFSPDDKTIVSASWDKTAKIWNAKTGELIRTLKGHRNMINDCGYSNNGKMIFTASLDNTIMIWNVETGDVIKTIESDVSDIISASFHPSDKQIIAAAGDKTIRVWDLQPALISMMVLRGHEGSVNCVKYSADSKYAISASDDKSLIVWNIREGKIERRITAHTDRINSIDVSLNGLYIASASMDNTVNIWSTHNWKLIKTLHGHEIGATCVAFAPDGKTIATADGNGDIGIWDWESGHLAKVINAHHLGVSDISFDYSGKILISSGAFEKDVKIWNVSSGKLIKTLYGHSSNVCSVSFSHDGNYALSSSWDHTIRIWDVHSGKTIRIIEKYIVSPVYSAHFNSDDSKIVSSEMYGDLCVWDSKTGALLQTLKGHHDGIKYARFSSDNCYIISASDDKTVRVWSFPPLQDLVNQNRARFKKRKLTSEERHQFYLE